MREYYKRNFGAKEVTVTKESVSIIGNYSSNFGTVYADNIGTGKQLFGMDWSYGLTDSVIDYINSSIEKLHFVHPLVVQWDDMLSRNTAPVMEYPLPGGDWLLVNLELSYTPKGFFNGIRFSFDTDGKKTHFDGDVRKVVDGVYIVPLDDCFDSLDHYMQVIDENISEGYLMPNDLFV